MATAPIEYATVGPKHQNRDDATMGPTPLARAPKDRKIPRAVPRSFILGTRDVAIEVRVGPQIADPVNKKICHVQTTAPPINVSTQINSVNIKYTN